MIKNKTMKEEFETTEISVHCGKTRDSLEKLEMLCKEEAEKRLTTIDVPDGATIEVPFWTADFPELIGVGKFQRGQNGKIVYDLDFSESTL